MAGVTVPGICMARDQLCTLFIHTCVGWQPNDFDLLFFLSYFYHLVGFRYFCGACGTLRRRGHFMFVRAWREFGLWFSHTLWSAHCFSQVTPAGDTTPQVHSTRGLKKGRSPRSGTGPGSPDSKCCALPHPLYRHILHTAALPDCARYPYACP